jgi:DNA-binding transcriptional LysR family regulator
MSAGDLLTDRDPQPTLRELEVLRAMIASRKTIAAATMLGISQPAVSRAIASLEARIGRTLFSRDGGRLAPTADAFALEAEAGEIFAALERLSRWPDGAHGRTLLRIASSPTLAQLLLTGFIARMRIAEPSLTYSVEICTGTDVLAAVADRRVDLGLLDMPVGHPAIRAETIREAHVHVLMPEDHPLAALPAISASDLADVPLILLPHRFAARGEIDKSFQRAGVRPNMVAEVSVTAFAAELVRQGLGLSIFNPFPLAMTAIPGTVWRPFHPMIQYRTYLLFPATGGVDPAARRFADMMARDMPEDGISRPVFPHGQRG